LIATAICLQLTSKDFGCQDNDCFPFLRTVKPFNYYSQVYQLLDALQEIAKLRNRTVIWEDEKSAIELPCLPNEIHVYNFTDNHLNAHDNFMEANSDALRDCPLIQIYTAHWEEFEAQKRRRERVEEQKESRQLEVRAEQKKPKNNAHVLRHILAVVSISQVVLADIVDIGLHTSFKRTEANITDGSGSLKLTMVDESSILNGFFIEISTSMGPLAIDVVPVSGNWQIHQLRFAKHIFKPRDLMFYGRQFSFCCQKIVAYSEVGSTLSISMFHMDIQMDRKDYSPLDLDYKAKSCWQCESFLTPGLTQALFTVALLLLILAIGLSMLLTIGRPQKFPSAYEPELYVKGYA
ncbi:hypothetical protein KR093_009882, partial [Drosophila rubida]